jgi:hypothetical protein
MKIQARKYTRTWIALTPSTSGSTASLIAVSWVGTLAEEKVSLATRLTPDLTSAHSATPLVVNYPRSSLMQQE